MPEESSRLHRDSIDFVLATILQKVESIQTDIADMKTAIEKHFADDKVAFEKLGREQSKIFILIIASAVSGASAHKLIETAASLFGG